MLMDLFFGASAVKRKRRAHFHEFMADVHERVQLCAPRDEGRARSPMTIRSGIVAAALAEEALAALLRRIPRHRYRRRDDPRPAVHAAVRAGVVVVATSNVEPDELYKDGLNRALFLPFIALLHEHMDVVRLEAPKDFRLEKLVGAAGVVRAGRRGCRGRARHGVAAPHRHAVGRAVRDRRQGSRHPRAGSREGCGAFFVPPAVRAAARRERLSAHRARIPHASFSNTSR